LGILPTAPTGSNSAAMIVLRRIELAAAICYSAAMTCQGRP